MSQKWLEFWACPTIIGAEKQEVMVGWRLIVAMRVSKQQVHHLIMVRENHTAWEVEVVGPGNPANPAAEAKKAGAS